MRRTSGTCAGLVFRAACYSAATGPAVGSGPDLRTEPRMGLRLKRAAGTALLHDGRAATIAPHAGEATTPATGSWRFRPVSVPHC